MIGKRAMNPIMEVLTREVIKRSSEASPAGKIWALMQERKFTCYPRSVD